MDVNRLSMGEKIAGASAVLLFIFMFFDWFSVSVSGGFLSATSGNAWDWLDVIPIILLLAIVAAVGVAVVRLTDAVFEPAISMNAVVAVLGAISFLLILYRIVSPPDSGFSEIDVSPAFGIFLGLIAAAGIAYGGYRAMQEEGVTFGDIGDQLGGGGRGRGGPGGGGHGGGTPPPPTQQQPPPPPRQQPPASSPPPPPPPPPPAQ
ncbi:MAG TPA: hypothetical protein VFX44_09780 [Solirubrobacterales bacterium]|nr:hypothetical protein [Solirubrobacterales bacterium]